MQGHPNSAIITLGTGVGGGLILNDQIFRGSHFQAGELSFLYGGKLEDKPILYGLRGSAVKMIHDIGKALHFENLGDGKAAFQAIIQKEEQAVKIFENYCRDIAILILDMHAMLDLTHYAIGGGISAQPILIEEINRQYDLLADSILDRGIKIVKLSLQRPQIIAATLGNDANLYGALYGLVNTEK
ncbi:ROK family protein [Enterococcus cecorum]